MREIKFRAWNTKDKKMYHVDVKHLLILTNKKGWLFGEPSWDWEIENETDETNGILMQYTGLKDANGKEIYEFCELNNKYRVLFKELKYVLQDISNGDIIDMEFKSRLYEITREYSPI